jgi:hypothetical protein
MRPAHPNIDLHPDDPQLVRLERHSYINLINVVHAELQLIERMIETPGKLRECIRLAEYASRAFKDRAVAVEHVEAFALFGESIERAVFKAVKESGAPGESDDVREAVGILESVLDDAQCRLHEVIARHGVDRPQTSLSIPEIERGIRKSFDGDVAMPAPEEVHALPVGLPGSLGRTLEGLRGSRGTNGGGDPSFTLRIDSTPTPGTPPQINVQGPGQPEAFAPLTSGLRPSQLHEQIRTGQTHLRGILELYYYSLPDGSCALRENEPGVRIECVLGSTK